MSSCLNKRVKTLEERDADLPPSREEIEQSMDRDLAKVGLTREEAVAKYGSLPAFVYWLLHEEVKASLLRPEPPPDGGLTAEERYMQMVAQPAPGGRER